MSEERIQELLAKAEPLRDPAHPEHNALGPLVDQINALRAASPAPVKAPDIDPEAERVKASLPRKIGRPKKVI